MVFYVNLYTDKRHEYAYTDMCFFKGHGYAYTDMCFLRTRICANGHEWGSVEWYFRKELERLIECFLFI